MTEISVTSKGQITIPAHLRKKHNIDETSKVEVVEENGKLVINKLVTIFDLAGTGDGDPETIKRELDQLRETDAKSSSL
jgi:AbrB family looped-hinge helix DNA binding protein